MARTVPSHPLFHLVLLFSRLTLGVYFLFTGIEKLIGEFSNGFGTFYHNLFQKLAPQWLPEGVAWFFGYAWPWAEAVFGAMLVVGLIGFLAAFLLALMLIGIMVGMATHDMLFVFQPAYKGPAITPYHYNIVYFGLAVLLTLTGGGRFSVDGLFHHRRARRLKVEAEEEEG